MQQQKIVLHKRNRGLGRGREEERGEKIVGRGRRKQGDHGRGNRVRRKYGPVGRVFPKDSINSKVFVTRNIIHEKENARSELSDLQHHKIINKRNN